MFVAVTTFSLSRSIVFVRPSISFPVKGVCISVCVAVIIVRGARKSFKDKLQ